MRNALVRSEQLPLEISDKTRGFRLCSGIAELKDEPSGHAKELIVRLLEGGNCVVCRRRTDNGERRMLIAHGRTYGCDILATFAIQHFDCPDYWVMDHNRMTSFESFADHIAAYL